MTKESIKLKTARLILEPVSADGFDQAYDIFTNEFVRKYLFDDEIISKLQVQSFSETSIQTLNQLEKEKITSAVTSALSLLNNEVQAIEFEELKKEYLSIIEQLETALEETNKDR